MATSTQAKVAALEGLDFIETEEDVKAVEAATLKIQSTFRGKKFRSKAKPEAAAAAAAKEAKEAPSKQVNKSAGQQEQQSEQLRQQQASASSKPSNATGSEEETNELSKRVGNMQVQDNSGQPAQLPGELPEEEAERAATKIQAGFKGYKTRKELEEGGKMPAASSAAGRQTAPADAKS